MNESDDGDLRLAPPAADASTPDAPPPPPSEPREPRSHRGSRRKEKRRRWWRRHPALAFLLLIPLLILPLLGGWVLYLNSQLGDVQRFEVDLARPDRPTASPTKAINVLLAGVDDLDRTSGPTLQEALSDKDWPAGVFRSDAIMVLHIDPSRTSAQIVSIPRDSLVEVEGYGSTKINAAFSYGGPQLLARTVEDVTNLRMDHVAVVDFDGLAKMTDILGGVSINLAKEEPKPGGGTWQPGTHLMNGEEALDYVRERKSLPDGDFGRVQRQQNYLRAMMISVIDAGVFTNPRTLTRLVRSLDKALAVDDKLTSGKMRSLGWALRGLRPGGVRFATIPHLGSARVDGASVVLLDEPKVRGMFKAAREDRLESWLEANPEARQLPAPDDVN